jgi:ubiquinone/menaquinone biosynthesis C-methylase UbiE
MDDVYTHGHHESVLRSHTWRTAENSAAYLLPHLAPGQDLLDVGCGPGTITLDLARLVAPGRTLGVDRAPEVVEQATRAASAAGIPTVQFAVDDIYALDLPDDSFEVAHAHQVLQHLTDPVAALRELRRVLRRGGILGVRDSDYRSFAWAPLDPAIERWNEVYHQVTRRNDAEADAGRHLLGWVRSAGFADVEASSSTWTFATPDERAWWGGLWADRCTDSGFAQQAQDYGIATAAEMQELAVGWRRWAATDDGFFMVPHGEVLARA